MDKTKTIPEAGVDSRLAYERLIKAELGEVVTYDELSRLVRRNVQADGRHVIETARRMAQREDQIVFECVRNVGLRRMLDGEIAQLGRPAIRSIRRKARRTVRKIACISDFDALKNEEKDSHNIGLCVLGVVAHCLEPRRVKKLGHKLLDSSHGLPTAAALDVLK